MLSNLKKTKSIDKDGVKAYFWEMINEVNEPQLQLFESSYKKKDTSTTFINNMKLPIHRWFRYSAGFSGAWVRELIAEKVARNIIDPFAGSGTVMIESDFAGINSYGIESHPFVSRLGKAKLLWKENPNKLKDASNKLLKLAAKHKIKQKEYPALIEKCYPSEVIAPLTALKETWQEIDEEESTKELLWFLITSILRKTSPVGTASWQYVLPNKSKRKVIDPFIAFQAKAHEMVSDMRAMQNKYPNYGSSRILAEDARNMNSVPDQWADLIITSPPYANNYDYGDATRLEMTFWGEIEGWGDLHELVRKNLIVSCTQHATKIRKLIESQIESPEIEPISEELKPIYQKLSEVRLTKGGKKNYQLMILAYFHDLAQVFKELRRTTKSDAEMCFVIGDSAPYGVYVPVDKWLGELALANGFKSFYFEKLRDRNTKWKNRKHRVPLKEGRLWIKG